MGPLYPRCCWAERLALPRPKGSPKRRKGLLRCAGRFAARLQRFAAGRRRDARPADAFTKRPSADQPDADPSRLHFSARCLPAPACAAWRSRFAGCCLAALAVSAGDFASPTQLRWLGFFRPPGAGVRSLGLSALLSLSACSPALMLFLPPQELETPAPVPKGAFFALRVGLGGLLGGRADAGGAGSMQSL